MLEHAWLFPAIPAVSFLLILLLGKRFPNKGSEIGIAALGVTFVLSVVAVVEWIQRVDEATGHSEGLRGLGRSIFSTEASGHGEAIVKPVIESITWWQNGAIKFTVGTRVDGLVVMMLFVVTLISLLVHVYSTAYLRGDVRYTHYYAMLSLFTASMLLLVTAGNTLQLLVGWEGVGLCSFALIGHWWEEGANSNAALKAFLTTRTGDIGLMIGIIITFFAAGTFDIDGINHWALSPGADHTLLLAGATCLFIGVIGKSGQFPLHTWLPDAMAGPTPVSALIHAATMVVAGVFLVARLYPVFYEGFSIYAGDVNFMAIIGGITILVGAVLAFVQRDIKKVLAYSTVSQLGYMVMALGVGAWTAAVFHLFTHAFFKALLFLGAGSVSHSGSHHSFDMKNDMGGLRKFMPITFWTFIIGTLALAGIFPFAGFWSKDEILVTAGASGFDVFMVVGLIGAFLTAAYMTRCVYLTFFGEYRGHGHPHESEPAITVPLIILAAFSILAGLLNAAPLGIEKFKEWVDPTVNFPELVHAEFDYPKAIISVSLAAIGIGVAAFFYFRKESLGALKGLTQRNKLAHAGYTLLERKFYLDDLYEKVIVGSIKGPIARGVYWFNQNVIDGVINGAGRGAVAAGAFVYNTIDQKVVDRAVNEIAEVTGETGGLLRYLQSGRVQRYALFLFAAVGLFSLALLIANIYLADPRGIVSMNWFDDWALTLAVFIPAVGMLIVMLIPRAEEQLIKVVTLLTTLVTFGVGIAILADFDYDSPLLQFNVKEKWIDVINSNYHVGIDGISLPLLVLSMFVTVLVVIYSWNHFPEPHNVKAFLALILLLEVGMNGTFVAQDLILFFIFFELVLLPMFFMIGVWGGPNREYASIKFFLFTLFGSAMMLLSFLGLFFLSKAQTFDIPELARLHGDGIVHGTQVLLFAGLFLGFAIKVPMWPFHTWLPDAHTEAPTVGSVLLAAIMLKLGTYGFIRIALPILPSGAQTWAPWIGLLAVIGIIYGALGCLAQRDMKRLIAFSSVAHMGFVMLGIATLTTFGINAAVFGMVAHGLITGMLFFVAGSVQERYGTREMSRLGGMLEQMPHMGWILGFCAMASLGLPGLAGFWGEFPAILSAYEPTLPFGLWGGTDGTLWTFHAFMVVAAIGTVLAAGYLLWMLQRVAMGKVKPEFEHLHVHDVHGPEWIAWTPMLILIVVLGIYPDLLFRITDPAVVKVVHEVARGVS